MKTTQLIRLISIINSLFIIPACSAQNPSESLLEDILEDLSVNNDIDNSVNTLNWENELEELKKHRDFSRSRRKKDGVLCAAIVGYTNVGKSTFLSKVTNARPKIANYHFTTLNPNLGVVDLEDAKGFVIADIPGLIEGASEGVGLGHELLRHIERTRLIVHIVDAASTEGRDPVADIYAINKELEAYDQTLAQRPQIIAANKIDMIYEKDDDPVEKLKAEFEPQGIPVYAISAVSGQGVRELLYAVNNRLGEMEDSRPLTFEQEFFPEFHFDIDKEPFTVVYDEEADEYVVEGPRIEKMLSYTNLESEKGFKFFQDFMRKQGILEQLEALGIEEGSTVRMYGLSFDYYK